MTPEERERRAKALMNDPLFVESFAELKKELLGQWEQSGSIDIDARESIWLAIRLLDRIHGHIKSIIETGHMAEVLDKQHPYL
jgi:hypothetical protein|tara:strand:+ start:2243 stop:2491 length:249 start_codon:yes stop_codon:yes gene_type:complete